VSRAPTHGPEKDELAQRRVDVKQQRARKVEAGEAAKVRLVKDDAHRQVQAVQAHGQRKGEKGVRQPRLGAVQRVAGAAARAA